MNRALLAPIAALAAAVSITVAAGCGGDSAPVPSGNDVKGTWNQAGEGFAKGEPYTSGSRVVVIDQAKGQAFGGYKEFTPPGGTPQREVVNGVIAPDGDILITDEDGFFEGTYADGVMTGQYAETGDDNAAVNLTLTRK